MDRFHRRPYWKVLFFSVRNMNKIPRTEDLYLGSTYYYWLKRISEGEKGELEWLNKLPEETLVDDNNNFLYSEEVSSAVSISSNMHAAFIVALWSAVEHTLKLYCKLCKAGNLTESNIEKNAGFKEFKKLIEECEIDFKNVSDYENINDVRILNNTFKHRNGFYSPPPPQKSYNKLHQNYSFPTFDDDSPAEIQKREGKGWSINYSELPHQILVLACGRFCQELLDKIHDKLKRNEDKQK